MATEKRIHVSLNHKDVELIQELEKVLLESKSGVIRRSVAHYHQEVFNKPWNSTVKDEEC